MSALKVTFQSRGRSARIWTALFDFGNPAVNAVQALAVAWKHNANILSEGAMQTLWSLRTNPARGNHWVAERQVTDETAHQWLTVFRADEPGVLFLVSARKPALPTRRAAPSANWVKEVFAPLPEKEAELLREYGP